MLKWLKHEISKQVGDTDFDVLIPHDSAMGDYSTNVAFVLAKHEKKNPLMVAEELAKKFKDSGNFSRVEAVKPGYVNFFLKPEFLQSELKRIHEHREHYGRQETGSGKTVIVEYSSPNIAKPMHVGHLRSTIIGDALANVYEALGYKVIRWNYIGDWGTQFGKLLVQQKKLGFLMSDLSVANKAYVEFHKDLENNPGLEVEAQREFQKLEAGDETNRALWSENRKASVEDLARTYQRLGVHFDLFKGESDYEAELKPIIGWLQKEGKIKESEGALIFELNGLPPAMLRKSDGATLYLTRDLASLGDRLKTYNPAQMVYVVANQQALHFEQLFAIARELKMDSAELTHVKFGMVLGEDGKKLATREGKVVLLQDVLDKIIKLAADVVKEKTPEVPEDEVNKISKTVGVGALKYNDLKQHPHTDIIFDWKQMLDLSGNSGPYLQYTYARLRSIMRNSTPVDSGLRNLWGFRKPDYTSLNHELELSLIKHLLNFSDTIKKCADEHALTGLALYLYELAAKASRYYETVRVLSDASKRPVRNARLVLVETVASVLKNGLNLLGIQTLERI